MDPVVVHLSDSVTIIHGDWRDAMPLPCDAVVSDPPYGFNYNPNRTRNKTSVQRGLVLKDRDWKQIHGEGDEFDPRPLLVAPIVLLWGANHYAHLLPSSKRWLVWDKRDGVASDLQSDCELAWCNVGGSVRMHRQLWRGVARAGEENIAISGEKLHPHQKPVALMEWCLEQAGIGPGATVLDPYMGSGTTGIACIRTGRKFIGIEIDAGHFSTARARLERELAQGVFDFGGGAVAPTHNPTVDPRPTGTGEKQ